MMGKMKHAPVLQTAWPIFLVCLCFFAGGVLGCLFASLAGEESVTQIGQYLADYCKLIGERRISWSVPAVLWNHGRWLLGCALLGLTGLGALMLPLLFGARGFLFAFGISCFFRIYSAAGLISALLLYVVPALLWAPGLFLTGFWGMRESIRLCRNRLSDTAALPGNTASFRLCVMMGFVLLVLCVFFECSLLPVLLPSAARILG